MNETFVKRFFAGDEARDPVTFAIAAAGLVPYGVAAAYLPARRASRIDPVVQLR